MRQRFTVSLVAALVLAAALPLGAQAQNRPARLAASRYINGIWQAMNSANWNLEGHAGVVQQGFLASRCHRRHPAGQSVGQGRQDPVSARSACEA
jgi:hypothetical protein